VTDTHTQDDLNALAGLVRDDANTERVVEQLALIAFEIQEAGAKIDRRLAQLLDLVGAEL
jgi:hypothetical protein